VGHSIFPHYGFQCCIARGLFGGSPQSTHDQLLELEVVQLAGAFFLFWSFFGAGIRLCLWLCVVDGKCLVVTGLSLVGGMCLCVVARLHVLTRRSSWLIASGHRRW